MPPDLTTRADPATLPELMDGDCPYEQFRDTVRDLAQVNRLLLAYRPTLSFLHRAATRARRSPLRVLDVGFGGGDTLRTVAGWAARRGLVLDLVGIDLNPHAARAAEEFSRAHPPALPIRWFTGDALSHPATQDSDLILSSLVTHHMRDPEIIAFLRWMEATARTGWFINDLLRSPRSYRLFGVLARLMRWHPFVQHDGPVSIRRAFRAADWQRLLLAAEIPIGAVAITQPVPGRLCLSRLRP